MARGRGGLANASQNPRDYCNLDKQETRRLTDEKLKEQERQRQKNEQQKKKLLEKKKESNSPQSKRKRKRMETQDEFLNFIKK